jgi:light-regulated signal transduction histidine kinase (bacteriophytochrome)
MNGSGTGISPIAVHADSIAATTIKAGSGPAREEKPCEKCDRLQASLTQALKELAGCKRDLEQFAYVASHDLQEPLRMVASYTKLLADLYRGKLDERADCYINYAVDGAARMQSLIRDLLAFSRAGRQEAELKPTDCNTVVAGAIDKMRVEITESGAVINRPVLPRLTANELQLQQVFQQLIGNAIKFRGAAAPVLDIAVQQQGSDWMFTVADNGIGIPAEQAENVFGIFSRLHTRAEYSGNGIGLAISKKIVERHGGTIQVSAHQGGGSIFRFTLPVEQSGGSGEST